MVRLMVTGAVLIAGAMGCGGTDSGSTGLQTEDEARSGCEAHCESLDGRCGPPNPEALDYCVSVCMERSSWIRGDAEQELQACVEELECDYEEWPCDDLVDPLDAHAGFETACNARVDECPGSELDEFSACVCPLEETLVEWVAPSEMPLLMECLEQPCSDVLLCFETALPNDGVSWVFSGCSS